MSAIDENERANPVPDDLWGTKRVPAESGYYWVQRTNGLWDVAKWSVKWGWTVLGYECEVKESRIVSWTPLTPPGPTESDD